MPKRARPQKAFVIGSGPNGLTAAIILARAGLPTTVFEAEPEIGGGTRSAELTLPGFLHDICSAVHPLAAGSPAFTRFPLRKHGLEWIHPPLPLAHPFDDGTAAILDSSLDRTCAGLGNDGAAYRRMVAPFVRRWNDFAREALQPVVHLPEHPVLLARFGIHAAWPARPQARRLFQTEAARALFAGIAAHSLLPLDAFGSAAFGWILAIAGHSAGWPIPRGGSRTIATALASHLRELGGSIVTNTRIRSLDEFDRSALLMCDVTPRQFASMAEGRLPDSRFIARMKKYRYGPGVFKIDWALGAPIPWTARECAQAGTVHVGGTLDEIAASEEAVWDGRICERPFVLVSQPSLFDATRAPEGKHTAWAYCHVPHASAIDMTGRIEDQIERFAPGFRSRILARHVFTPAQLEQHNANLTGGDISGGANTLRQLVFRPTHILYRTPLDGVYVCSSSTPPGAGVHGMCGFHAARLALRDYGITEG
jgi:phytoene dehydrogenase-like protein